MNTLKRLLDLLPWNGNKSNLGGALVTLGLTLGILTQQDVELLNGTIPVIVAGCGAAVQVIGWAHKWLKRFHS